jgi:hypothetical protein
MGCPYEYGIELITRPAASKGAKGRFSQGALQTLPQPVWRSKGLACEGVDDREAYTDGKASEELPGQTER